jgi:phosphatidylglycerophosphate synthase
MFDEWFRLHKERWLTPLALMLGRTASPLGVTLLALVVGLASAVAAARSAWTVALVLWIANRVLDGVDGTLARVQHRQSDFGGYLDILLDFVVYAAVPIGIALALDTRAVWLATVVLLASWFVNAASWMYLAAVLERRGQGAQARGELTTVTMPRGLVAGTETVVFFVLFLALPAHFATLAWLMAAGVGVGITQRVLWAARHLHAPPE